MFCTGRIPMKPEEVARSNELTSYLRIETDGNQPEIIITKLIQITREVSILAT